MIHIDLTNANHDEEMQFLGLISEFIERSGREWRIHTTGDNVKVHGKDKYEPIKIQLADGDLTDLFGIEEE